MMTKPFMTLCVNLDRSPDRRRDITAQAEALGLEVEFVSAVDGELVGPDDPEMARYNRAKRNLTWRRDLSQAEIACVLSHRRAITRFLASDFPFAVVLEDDAVLSPSFPQRLQAVLAAPDRWSIVRLEARSRDEYSEVIATLEDGARLVLRRKWTLGGTAILYSRHSARTFLDRTERFFEAFDNLVGRPHVVGDVILELEPPIVEENKAAPSTIEKTRTGPTNKKNMRPVWKWLTSLNRIWSRRRLRRG
jgi:glycosyl transferase family 25